MATGFTAGDACMVTIAGERKRGRFVAEVNEGYEVELRAPNGKRYLSPQVFVRDDVSTPTLEEINMRAHATSEKSKREKGSKYDHRVGVTLKAASIGSTTAGIGFEVQRASQDEVTETELSLIDARLECRLSVEPDQAEMFEGSKPDLSSVGDVNRISVGRASITARITFRKDDVDLDALSSFAQKSATLDFTRVGAREKSEAEDEGEAE